LKSNAVLKIFGVLLVVGAFFGLMLYLTAHPASIMSFAEDRKAGEVITVRGALAEQTTCPITSLPNYEVKVSNTQPSSCSSPCVATEIYLNGVLKSAPIVYKGVPYTQGIGDDQLLVSLQDKYEINGISHFKISVGLMGVWDKYQCGIACVEGETTNQHCVGRDSVFKVCRSGRFYEAYNYNVAECAGAGVANPSVSVPSAAPTATAVPSVPIFGDVSSPTPSPSVEGTPTPTPDAGKAELKCGFGLKLSEETGNCDPDWMLIGGGLAAFVVLLGGVILLARRK